MGKPIMTYDVYMKAVELFGLDKKLADDCGQIIIRLSVGDFVRVEYHTIAKKEAANGLRP